MSLAEYLQKKLGEAFSQPWGPRGTLRHHLSGFIEAPETGALSGTLCVYAQAPSKGETLVYEQKFETLLNPEDVDDFLGDSLSRLLAFHTSWPR